MTPEQVTKVIEAEINPALEFHAGGCELVDIQDGVITIRLYGGCSGCPSSHITLFNGIVPIFKDHFPDVKDVLLG